MKLFGILMLTLLTLPLFGDYTSFAEEKIIFHEKKALDNYYIAQEICWSLPDSDERAGAIFCFEYVFVYMGYDEPNSFTTREILDLLKETKINTNDDWEQIYYNLTWAIYHFEMVEYYQDILSRSRQG